MITNLTKTHLKLAIIPFSVLFISISVVGNGMLTQGSEELLGLFFSKGIFSITIHVTTIVIIYSIIIEQLNKHLPWEAKKKYKRLLVQGGIILLNSILATFIIVHYRAPEMPDSIKMSSFVMFVLPMSQHVLVVIVIELIDMYYAKNKLAIDLERVEKEHIVTKYNSLVSQLDHHFLFNNLSVLSSIIYEDVGKADKFIQELSKVYRYVINLREEFLVTLEEELKFLDSYRFLMKIRFENGINFDIQLDQTVLKKYIPPLTIQTLVENAIKHNVVAEKKPLLIQLVEEEGFLVVKNNFQPRDEVLMESTHTGLKNLEKKFNLISTKNPSFTVENDCFVARIPLTIPEND